jgi:hypothetical protein
MKEYKTKAAPNIYYRHKKSCSGPVTGRCNCQPSFEARIYSDGRTATYSARTLPEARNWLVDKRTAINKGLGLPARVRFADAARDFIDGLEEGTVLNAYGEP